ncbi:MAG: GGDEF domain-containing protein [Clostridia bacterium]|nr:GGDEF domain-containing protein [Clostridia bacterium]
MENVLYCTLNVFCVMVLVTILKKLHISVDKRTSQIMLKWFIIASVVLCTSDVAWGILDFTNSWVAMPYLSFVVNSIYHAFTGVVAYLWFLFSESEQDSRIVRSKLGLAISIIPLIVLVGVVGGSASTGWIFRIDSTGEYQRGDWYLILITICFAYLFVTSARMFGKSLMKKHYVKRQYYRSMSSFCIAPAVAGVLQVIFKGSPMLSAGVAFAALQVYMNFTEQLATVDSMTKLNNRKQLESHLYNKMKSYNDSRDLTVFIMDLDYFKGINDEYGHVEGDEAIMIAAEAIRRLVYKYNFFGSRYGGDEFVVVAETAKDYKPKEFITELNNELVKLAGERGKPYTLHFSVGYKRYDSSIRDIPTFIAKADEGLYHIKNSRHVLKAEKNANKAD